MIKRAWGKAPQALFSGCACATDFNSVKINFRGNLLCQFMQQLNLT